MEINVKNEKIKLKKDHLTNGEVNYMIGEVLKIYNQSGDIEGYNYSPLSMITNFYALLFSLVIEDFDIDNIDDYNRYYNIGTHYELLRVITNADEAYHLMMSLSKQLVSVENIVERSLQVLTTKIPDMKSMSKMMETLPQDWQTVFSEYNQITGKDKNKEDE